MIQTLTLLDDFGDCDEYVSSVKARILLINPQATIVDISHQVPVYDVFAGAHLLMVACSAFPKAVYVAVVDPGVGSNRRPLALRASNGSWFVGPDNGILLPAVEKMGGIAEAYELKTEYFAWWGVSSTFHARDIFGPAAAIISLDEDGTLVGDFIEADVLTEAPFKMLMATGKEAEATILGIDHFGSLRLNIAWGCWYEFDKAVKVKVEVRDKKYILERKNTFYEVEKGQLFVYLDSSGYYGITANKAEAAEIVNVFPGERIGLKII